MPGFFGGSSFNDGTTQTVLLRDPPLKGGPVRTQTVPSGCQRRYGLLLVACQRPPARGKAAAGVGFDSESEADSAGPPPSRTLRAKWQRTDLPVYKVGMLQAPAREEPAASKGGLVPFGQFHGPLNLKSLPRIWQFAYGPSC